jgi:hypothetical protein
MSVAGEFRLQRITPEAERVREEVRQFLAAELREAPRWQRAFSWSGFDAGFSRKMAARGWIGMTWPRRYGGGERSAFERYVMLEEVLAAGAPVGAHWIADRQTGPLLLRAGTEEQRVRFLPAIARAEAFFCIGMSEPDSGSDLASVRTRATPAPGGWHVNGSKIWTTGANKCQFMIALVRTRPIEKSKHEGLSQIIIDLASAGVTIRPIRDLAGSEHFCEVSFEDVFVPDNLLVGREGDGWKQVTSELAFERSGPERLLSSFPLFADCLAALGPDTAEAAAAEIGRKLADLVTLRVMSISVAGMLGEGLDPMLQASIVKDLGCLHEQQVPILVEALSGAEPRNDERATDFERMLGTLLQNTPSFSLRGGTREILRGIIARGLGLR